LIETTLHLPAVPESAREARGCVRKLLQEWGYGRSSDVVVLLTSEVVTNALLHGSLKAPSDELVIRVICGDRGVSVEVHDNESDTPRIAAVSSRAGSGRGLVILEALARAWDVRPDSTGKTVSFEVSAEMCEESEEDVTSSRVSARRGGIPRTSKPRREKYSPPSVR
jgi:anti-sigma regulatory factor (Ser/Thr protein kinase)